MNAKCNVASKLYCSPTQGEILTENQTYELDYNAKFNSIAHFSKVDVYLYHAEDSSLADQIPSVPNHGSMTFTVDDVRPLGLTLYLLDLVYTSTYDDDSIVCVSMVRGGRRAIL